MPRLAHARGPCGRSRERRLQPDLHAAPHDRPRRQEGKALGCPHRRAALVRCGVRSVPPGRPLPAASV